MYQNLWDGLGFMAYGLGFRVKGTKVQGLECIVRALGFRGLG
jgi:hypothetical protein